jgi:hypothetical protein
LTNRKTPTTIAIAQMISTTHSGAFEPWSVVWAGTNATGVLTYSPRPFRIMNRIEVTIPMTITANISTMMIKAGTPVTLALAASVISNTLPTSTPVISEAPCPDRMHSNPQASPS